MEQGMEMKRTVRRTAVGVGIAMGAYLALAAAIAYLAVCGVLPENQCSAATLAAAGAAGFAGALYTQYGAGNFAAAAGAAVFWSLVQFWGFVIYDGLTPKRSVLLMLPIALGAITACLCRRRSGKKRGKRRVRRSRR